MKLADGQFGLLPLPAVQAGQLAAFDCGKAGLNQFLTHQALLSHQSLLSHTSAVFHTDYEGLVGYFTLCNDAVQLKDSERFDLGLDQEVTLNHFPAVKIGRLAVSHDLQGRGVGTAIMTLIRGGLMGTATLSAARLLSVDADNDELVLRFYGKMGFEPSLWAEDRQKHHGGRSGKRPTTIKMLRDILKD